MGDHLLEDYPTTLEKIIKKKSVNALLCVQKCDIIRTKNLHVVTRQGTKTGNDNPRIIKIYKRMVILALENKNNCTMMHQTCSKNSPDKKKLIAVEKCLTIII